MDTTRRLLKWTHAVEDGLLALMVTAMIILAVTQIGLRNLFDSGIVWIDPLLRTLVLWLGLMGAMAATRDDNHIRIDILSRLLPPTARRWSRAAGDLFAAIVCGLFAYHSGRFLVMDYQDEIIAFGDLPAWVAELILPLGFGVMALRFTLLTISGPRNVSDKTVNNGEAAP